MRKIGLLGLVCFLALGFLLARLETGEAATAKVKVGGSFTASSAPPIIAARGKGWFEKEGLDVETILIRDFTQQPPLLAGHQIDILVGVIQANYWSILAQGADFRVISGGTQSARPTGKEPARNIRGFVVRKDLYDSGAIKTLADLAGRKAANFGTVGKIPNLYVYDRIFGNTWPKVNWVRIPAEKDIMTALRQKLIDAAYMRAPFFSWAVRDGLGVELFKETDYLASIQNDVVSTTATFLKGNANTAVAFLRAYLKALEYSREVQQGQHLEEYKSFVKKYTDYPVDIAMELIQAVKYSADLDMDSIREHLAYNTKTGVVQGRISLDQVVDLSYLNKARQTLK